MSDRSGYRCDPIDPESGKRWPAMPQVFAVAAYAAEAAGFPELAPDEHAVMAVPPIITEAEYYAVQAALKARSPQWMPPRAVIGPTLLTGICFCASYGGALTLRTGKGSAGGMYRYDTCSTKARQGRLPTDRFRRGWWDSCPLCTRHVVGVRDQSGPFPSLWA